MNVFVADEQDDPLAAEPLRRLAEAVLREEGLPEDTEVALMFVEPSQMEEYNRRFMGREGPTDVLAFPLEELEPGEAPGIRPEGPPLNLGDVIIAPAVVRRQARSSGIPVDREMALMVVHGLLHLLGYDHQADDEAEEMEARELELLEMAGERPEAPT